MEITGGIYKAGTKGLAILENSHACNPLCLEHSYDLDMVAKSNPESRYPMTLRDAIAALFRGNPLPRKREPKSTQVLKRAGLRP